MEIICIFCNFVNVCCWYCSGAFIKVVFETSTNTVNLSGSAAAVDAAFNYIQSNYIDAMCHEDFHLCLPGNCLF